MSDALLERQAVALESMLALLKKSPVLGLPTGGAATPPKTPAAASHGPDAAKKAAADKAAAEKAKAAVTAKADAAAAASAKTKAGPPAGTKAPGGKHTIDQVREIVRKVAGDVDKQSAKDILKDDGNGADKVIDLKPEFYDAVYEACEVLLGGESNKSGTEATAEEDDFA
jgi:hypothetical protein